jgi:hypothetical protein
MRPSAAQRELVPRGDFGLAKTTFETCPIREENHSGDFENVLGQWRSKTIANPYRTATAILATRDRDFGIAMRFSDGPRGNPCGAEVVDESARQNDR